MDKDKLTVKNTDDVWKENQGQIIPEPGKPLEKLIFGFMVEIKSLVTDYTSYNLITVKIEREAIVVVEEVEPAVLEEEEVEEETVAEAAVPEEALEEIPIVSTEAA